MWVRARAASSNLKETVSSVSAGFGADSGTNLIKEGVTETGRSCGSVAQWYSARTVSERPWVRVPVGLLYFSALVTA